MSGKHDHEFCSSLEFGEPVKPPNHPQWHPPQGVLLMHELFFLVVTAELASQPDLLN
jgi:hypothetical protein